MFSIFKKKKSLATLMALFIVMVDELRQLASDKLKEAKEAEDKARTLLADAEAAEDEAEEALAAADRIEELVGGSVILEAAAEKL